jgi:hypothetical protein
MTRIALFAALAVLLPAVALGAPPAKAPPKKDAPNAADAFRPAVGPERAKNISFDDEVVESMNKSPLDSLENVARRDSKKQPHLYRKRRDFKKEMKETIKEMGTSP